VQLGATTTKKNTGIQEKKKHAMTLYHFNAPDTWRKQEEKHFFSSFSFLGTLK
jgi:hypothetical protein